MDESQSPGNKVKVIILYGGQTTEHEISCRSAAFLAKNLDPNRFQVDAICVGKDGSWRQVDEKFSRDAVKDMLPSLSSSEPIHLEQLIATQASNAVFFPIIHGSGGEDGNLQGLLEMANVPYVGADCLGSALAMDKEVAKRLVAADGIPIVPYVSFREQDWLNDGDTIIKKCRSLGDTVFVKPARGGSSVGVYKAEGPQQIKEKIDDALQFDDKILIEKAVTAREIECAALGGYHPKISVPGEIINHGNFYTYEEKYAAGSRAEISIPAKLSKTQVQTVQDLALKAFTCLQLFGLARVDFFFEESSETFYFNEVNSLPGFTSISQYPLLWKASGIGHQELLSKLVDLAIERQRRRSTLIRSYTPKP